MEIHSWCCAWLCKFTPTWCWPRVFTRLQRVLVQFVSGYSWLKSSFYDYELLFKMEGNLELSHCIVWKMRTIVTEHTQYVPWNMHIGLFFVFYCALVCLILPISFRVPLMALGQSYGCPSASEATLKGIGKLRYINHVNPLGHHNITKPILSTTKLMHILWDRPGITCSKLFVRYGAHASSWCVKPLPNMQQAVSHCVSHCLLSTSHSRSTWLLQ